MPTQPHADGLIGELLGMTSSGTEPSTDFLYSHVSEFKCFEVVSWDFGIPGVGHSTVQELVLKETSSMYIFNRLCWGWWLRRCCICSHSENVNMLFFCALSPDTYLGDISLCLVPSATGK